MKNSRLLILAAVITALNYPIAVQTQASLFKIDFGHMENERAPLDPDGNPLATPANLVDWTVLPTWTFEDPNASVTEGSASAIGTANPDGPEVTWTLIDVSSNPKNNVTLTIFDNKPLAESLNPDNPPFMQGMTSNNPTKEGIDVVYDGVRVPYLVKDDYLYRLPDAAGSETLMRIANLDPGTYNVTVFEGRTTDGNGRFGKVWVDDKTGAKEPSAQNTGNYSGVDDTGAILYKGQPRTVTVTIKTGEYLWFAEMEDNSGGISGMIIRSVDPVDSPGLFKIDFGHMENERVPLAADGTPQLDAGGTEVGAPEPLKDWNVIPTWTYEAPNTNVAEGSASVAGTASADNLEVTWKLTDFSKDGNKNVTMTIKDNRALAETLSPDSPPYMQGMTANNPTKEGIAVIYDGVLVPAVVKDDYLYRLPDTAGSESLIRFAGLKPGKYNVTPFEGRTTDGNGRFGKVWVDDINGSNEPAAQNSGNYSGVASDGTVLPLGQAPTVTVEIKAGQYLWFAEMEDNSGGISGMIIRGVGGVAPSTPINITKTELSGANVTLTWTGGTAPFKVQRRASVGTDTWVDVGTSTSNQSATVPQGGATGFYRVVGQ